MSQNQSKSSSGDNRRVPIGEMVGANAPFNGVVRPGSAENIRQGSIGTNAIINKPVAPNPVSIQPASQNGIGTSAITTKPVKPIEKPKDN